MGVNVSRLEKEFEYVRMLGSGEFGTVFAYKHRLGMVPVHFQAFDLII